MKEHNKLSKLVHDWTILCLGSSVDEQSNNLSIFNIIETLGLEFIPSTEQEKEKEREGFYSVPLNFQLVTKLQKYDIDSEISFDMRYQITDPEGVSIGKGFGSTITFGKGTDNLRIRSNIGMFPVTKKGVYHVCVMIGEIGTDNLEKVGEMSFKVNLNIKANG
jgi:hypothetical protein